MFQNMHRLGFALLRLGRQRRPGLLHVSSAALSGHHFSHAPASVQDLWGFSHHRSFAAAAGQVFSAPRPPPSSGLGGVRTRWAVPPPRPPSPADGLPGGGGGRVVALGDVHGDHDAFEEMLVVAGLVSARGGAWAASDAVAVQVGDVLDRGVGEVRSRSCGPLTALALFFI